MAAKKKDAAPAEEAVTDTPLAETSPPENEPPPGVFVAKVRTDDGGIRTQVVIQGAVEPTEVQTLLELGVRGWREQIGLAG